ncbi:metallophosphoesterase family protein [Bifidobacterium simiarum]|uniref:metallophosphoesterase family protein n=1 Tax=Bifidobacterium simiarum TaxID=2045441 RepID=UPI001BDBB5B3|nr:DNA repair exonuclease [Bifidobacterium simiarum]MBT1165566.1 DNA repair exonuclease [Bifidobacterium simiarum]
MKILHTSDWHIGRRFKGLDLADYQRRALDWLVGLVRRERVDVVCVSGDVYDSPMPSAASVDLLDDVLTRLTGIVDDDGRPAVDVIVTPGNHDSARKLGFGARMMRPNLHLRCAIEDLATPVIVRRGGGAGDGAGTGDGVIDTGEVGAGETVAVYALPYLDPDVARPVLERMLGESEGDGSGEGAGSGGEAGFGEGTAESIPRSHEGVMTAAMRMIRKDLARRRETDPAMTAVLMAHAFVTGAAPTDSERNIAVGGVDSVPAAVFAGAGLDYLALGHLHRPQAVSVPDTVPGGMGAHRETLARYSGSLLAYSFSEACRPPKVGNGKSVVLIETGGDGCVRADTVRVIPVESGEPALVKLRGSMAELTGPLAAGHAHDWVSLTVTEPEYPHGMYARLDECYASALEKQFEPIWRAGAGLLGDAAGGTGVDGTGADGMGADGVAAMANLRQSHSEFDVVKSFVRYTLGRDPDEAETDVLQEAIERARQED